MRDNNGQFFFAGGVLIYKKLPIPSREELSRLYESDHLTTRQIAKLYKVDKSTILKWLKRYSIKRRPSHSSPNYQRDNKPTKNKLYNMVYQDNLTYVQIAEIYNCDASLVGYWLDQFGIPRPGQGKVDRFKLNKSKQVLPKELLHDLYIKKSYSLRNIGAKFNIPPSRVAKLCEIYGIKRRKDGWNSKRLVCNDGHEVRSTYELRVDNWLSRNNIDHIYEPRLSFDRRYKADFMANGWYIEIWGVIGSAKYNRRKANKVALYKAHNAPLIEIPCHAFDSQRNRQWARLLKKCTQMVMPSMLQQCF